MILKVLATCTIFSTIVGIGCDRSSSSTAATMASPEAAGPAATNVAVNGAGSTFINPLMSKWSSEYQRVEPTAHVNYQSIGSGGGIRQLLARTVQFGATDAPMTDDQLKEGKSAILHVPLVMGAVVATYNLPTLPHPIRFTPEALAGI